MPDGSAFSQEDIDLLLANVDQLSAEELAELEEIVSDLAERQRVQRLRDDLIAFCQHMQDDYKVGAHHRRLADLLEDIEASRKDRICVSVPPRHGKSQLVSIYYAAWYIGRNPSHKIMLVSHTTDLAVDFGRKIRNLIATDKYREVFPDVALASDSKSAGRWNTNQGGEFFAAGVGSALAGRGAHLLLVDDPHSEQDVLNGNFEVFTKAYEWFTFGARTRLMPGGRVAIVHCMTGDTGVLRPDGTETPLREIRPGDMIASYKDGELVNRKVLNWANQGSDKVYTIRMSNGSLSRANARHPFLVVRDGEETWVKVQDLKVGDFVVSLKAAATLARQRQSQALVKPAAAGSHTTENIKTHNAGRLATKAGGKMLFALRSAAMSLLAVTGYAKIMQPTPITIRKKRSTSTTAQIDAGTATSNSNTESQPRTMIGFLPSRMANARAVCWPWKTLQFLAIGAKKIPSLSTTAMVQAKCEDCYATGATSSSAKVSPKRCSCGPFSTSEIISITPDGEEDVFDIEVEDTHNFIANFCVVSNTRWHMDDLIGRVVRDMAKNEGADQYEVFEFPAILTSTDPDTGKTTEKALWPEFFDIPALLRTKASMPAFQWNAQYQQQPTAEEAAVIKREWWRQWERDQPPPCDYIIASLDAAAETHNRADYTSLTLWGVFLNEEEDHHQLILLHAVKERLEFPELKKLALDIYRDWEPDSFIVEKKSAGVALYQELRRTGLPITEYTPHRGTGDKMARLNSVADIISSGMVWVPDRRWAEEVVEEIAAFPFASNDDHVDSTVMALLRFRQGGFIALPTDEIDEPQYQLPQREGYY